MNRNLVITGAAAALTVVPTVAGAAPPSTHDLAGVTITCGDEVLTFTAGVMVGDLRRVERGNGGEVVTNNVVLHGATLVGEEGGTYRAVGGASSTARIPADADPDDLAYHDNIHITVLGDQGRLGRIVLRERVGQDGRSSYVEGGGCSL